MHKFTDITHRSIAWLKSANDSRQLQMTPPYQRNPVWTIRQKSALIETILLEYPIPEIYMQDITDETGKENHIVVDGQQRIRAVLEYVTGEYAIDVEGSRWDALYFEDLTAGDRKKIFEYKFVTRILPEISDEQIRSIFQRINRNTVSLNAQELRHATYWGPFIKLMEELADIDYWNDFGVFSPNDRRRMLDTEFISEIAIAYLNGFQNKKAKLESYYQIYETEFNDEHKLRSIFFKVLGELQMLLPNLAQTRYKKKSDFYTLFLVLASFEQQLPFSLEQRAGLSEVLMHFAGEVDRALSDARGVMSEAAHIYSKNVERAASDLGARRNRHLALSEIVEGALNARPADAKDAVFAAVAIETLDAGDVEAESAIEKAEGDAGE